jgi:serine/threonine protein kinase
VFNPGDTLKQRYQLQQQLGHTAVGHQTWLAIDLDSQTEVTVKLLAFSPQMQWEELKLFEREAQVLQSLEHPRIPRYQDYFDIDKNTGNGVPWFALVQDYIPGNSLQELLERGKRFSEKQIRSMATEILEILIYLHELSPPVLHRDIKPGNLILGEDEHIYLIDFGAVQAQAAVTGVTFTVVGTSGYAPLEQFWGRAVPASDLYALGATLVHLLTGVAPADLPQKDSRIQFADKLNVKPELVTLISWLEKLTDIALEKRFSSAREALQILKSGEFVKKSLARSISRTGRTRKLSQPYYSKIKLHKEPNYLKITIPPIGLRGIFLIIRHLGCFGFIYLWFFALLLGIGFLPGLVILILALLIMILTTCCKTIYLKFNPDKFMITWKIGMIRIFSTQRNNNQVLGIFLHHKGERIDLSLRRDNGGDFLGAALTDFEAAWLAQEIQDWLDYREE